ncbi:BsuBI/PstI family type II restriction endonuclease [Thermosynechococcaceae cyanobacterium Okahandja]
METRSLLVEPIQRDNLLERVDFLRLEASQRLTADRAEKGQFFTPKKIACFMASMFAKRPHTLNLLDAGAGVGSLSAAFIAEACQWNPKPSIMTITAYEIDPILTEYLHITLGYCQEVCRQEKINFEYKVIQDDYIRASVDALSGNTLFASCKSFNAAILNPPYRKINAHSTTRRLLQKVGIETTNLYAAFLWLTIRLLESNGELVAITPRSFCNGPYFLPFREVLLRTMSINHIHVFDYRDRAFEEDNVLQENVILHATRARQQEKVAISSSADPNDPSITVREVEYDQLVYPDDPNSFIHIVTDGLRQRIGQKARSLSASLDELGITVSTGKVVDFRAAGFLTENPDAETIPLIYPSNFLQGYVAWPNRQNRKPFAIRLAEETTSLFVPSGWYVLVKRFSAKEEKRRVVAAICDPTRLNAEFIGIENHLNYYHQNGKGLPPLVAKGLAAFLNSTLVDEYFRQFSGHTQVNATDLRNLRYPSLSQLMAIGEKIGDEFPKEEEIDQIVLGILGMDTTNTDVKAKKRIEEALDILRSLQVPRAQLNQRSALTLLALLDMKPDTDWSNASAPLRGITEMMDYFRDHFGISYAPNTRETVRRFTVHQFVQMGLVIANPDDIARPVNSPKTKYQVDTGLLKVIRTYRTREWDRNLRAYLKNSQELRKLREKEREMTLIPVKLPDGREVRITAGGQNALIKQIIEQFCPRFTPEGWVVYVGDAGDKLRVYEQHILAQLGVIVDEHSKMPDVVVYFKDKKWLVLIEAVTSHGPIDIKRHNELKQLFRYSKAPLVFVTAFPTRKVMMKYLQEIAWETEVWVAEESSHLIHFNGERFLGPYDE